MNELQLDSRDLTTSIKAQIFLSSYIRQSFKITNVEDNLSKPEIDESVLDKCPKELQNILDNDEYWDNYEL